MTDARFPERWLNDRRINRLNGDAHKLFSFAVMWSVANRTEGVITDDDLADIHHTDHAQIPMLEKVGLWRREAGGWVITVFADTQTSVAELEAAEAARVHAREKKARQRLRQREGGLLSPGTSQDRPDQDSDRTGSDRGGGSWASKDEKANEDWPDTPTAQVPIQAAAVEQSPRFDFLKDRAAEHESKSRR